MKPWFITRKPAASVSSTPDYLKHNRAPFALHICPVAAAKALALSGASIVALTAALATSPARAVAQSPLETSAVAEEAETTLTEETSSEQAAGTSTVATTPVVAAAPTPEDTPEPADTPVPTETLEPASTSAAPATSAAQDSADKPGQNESSEVAELQKDSNPQPEPLTEAVTPALAKTRTITPVTVTTPSEPVVDPEPVAHQKGWNKINGSYYWYDSETSQQAHTGWLVTDQNPTGAKTGLERYWLDANGALATMRLIDPTTEQSGYYSFATELGIIVRGKWVNPTNQYVYLANNDGKLEDPGWHVTGAYDNGNLERYYIDTVAHAAIPGYSAEGYDHYTQADGRVLRGMYQASNGNVYFADNDGKLMNSGWNVTGAYTNGALERYYIDPEAHAAVPGYSKEGYDHYTLANGTVLRSKYTDSSSGLVYLADNDGRLLNPGWHVTGVYNGGNLERYYIDAKNHAATPGYSADGYEHYTMASGQVLRGRFEDAQGNIFFANNDGMLMPAGWNVTGDYTNGALQRYYIDPDTHAAKAGFSSKGGWSHNTTAFGYVARGGIANNEGVIDANGWVVTDQFGQGLQRYFFREGQIATGLITQDEAGWWAYGRPEGYVARGVYNSPDGLVYLANNDGKLENPGWLVSGAYTSGELQRYYIDETTHAARSGYFSVAGKDYYGSHTTGAVVRGTVHLEGHTLRADNDGVLETTIEADVPAQKKGASAHITSTFVGDDQYLFLPAYANTNNIALSFKTPSHPEGILISASTENFKNVKSGETVNLADFTYANKAWTIFFKQAADAAVRTLKVMKSANVRSMFIVSSDPIHQGREYIESTSNHSTKTTGAMLLVNPDGSVVYNKGLDELKGRGNGTWGAAVKKPYQIKLSKKTDLLETGNAANKNKTWVLLANAGDPTQLRNSVAFAYAQSLGLEYTPEFAPIDLYYDGEYRGSYLLTEKVQVKPGRVDMYSLADAIEEANPGKDLDALPTAQATNAFGQTFQYVQGINDPQDISGGYLLEFDIAYWSGERCWFHTSVGAFTIKDPDNLSYNQMKYISEFVQNAINTAQAHPATGLGQFYDINSMVKMYAVNQFSKNADWHVSSSYWYLPSYADASHEHKLYAGPAWDFDTGFGIRKEDYLLHTGTFRQPDDKVMFVDKLPVWFTKIEEFQSAVRAAQDLLTSKAERFDKTSSQQVIQQMIDQIAQSESLNEVIWGLNTLNNCIPPLATFDENMAYFENWISTRVAWLKRNGWI